MPVNIGEDSLIFQSILENNSIIIFLGHYNIPNYSNSKLLLPGNSQLKLITHETHDNNKEEETVEDSLLELKQVSQSVGVQTDDDHDFDEFVETPTLLNNLVTFLPKTYNSIKQWVNQQENKGYKLMFIILFGCMIAMIWYIKMQVNNVKESELYSELLINEI